MKKRIVPTILALVIFVGLFIHVNVNEVAEIPEPGQDLPVDLATIPAADVRSILLETAAEKTNQKAEATREKIRLVSKKENSVNRFEIVEPRALRVENSEVEGLLRFFENLKSERVISKTATDTLPYGISSTSPLLTLETSSGTVGFTLGDDNPIGGLVYLQKSGDPAIYLVSGVVKGGFLKKVDDLRARNIFFEDFSGVTALTLESASGTYKIEKNKGGQWHMVSPKECEADSGEITSIIFGIRDLKVQKFVDESPTDKAKYGLDKPIFKVTLTDASSTFVLNVGGADGGSMFVSRADQPNVYAVARGAILAFHKDFNRLRNKELPKVSRTDLKSLRLKTASDTFELQYASGTWMAGGKPVDMAKVNALVDSYQSNKIVTFLALDDRKNECLDMVAGCDSLELTTATVTRKVFFGKGDGSLISLMVDDQQEILKLPMALYNSFTDLVQAVKQPPQPAAPVSGTGGVPASGMSVVPDVGQAKSPSSGVVVIPGPAPMKPDVPPTDKK